MKMKLRSGKQTQQPSKRVKKSRVAPVKRAKKRVKKSRAPVKRPRVLQPINFKRTICRAVQPNRVEKPPPTAEERASAEADYKKHEVAEAAARKARAGFSYEIPACLQRMDRKRFFESNGSNYPFSVSSFYD